MSDLCDLLARKTFSVHDVLQCQVEGLTAAEIARAHDLLAASDLTAAERDGVRLVLPKPIVAPPREVVVVGARAPDPPPSADAGPSASKRMRVEGGKVDTAWGRDALGSTDSDSDSDDDTNFVVVYDDDETEDDAPPPPAAPQVSAAADPDDEDQPYVGLGHDMPIDQAFLDETEAIAREDARRNIERLNENNCRHLCTIATSYLKLSETNRIRQGGARCEVWSVSQELLEFVGLAAAQEFARSGTLYRTNYQDMEYLYRYAFDNAERIEMMKDNAHQSDTHAKFIDHIPLRVAKYGRWPTVEEYRRDIVAVRQRVLRFISECDDIIRRLKDEFSKLKRAEDCETPKERYDMVREIITNLDKRPRNKNKKPGEDKDLLKISIKSTYEVDRQFANFFLPVDPTLPPKEQRRDAGIHMILTVLHNLRVKSWEYDSNEERPFEGKFVQNEPSLLNELIKTRAKTRSRLKAAKNIVKELSGAIFDLRWCDVAVPDGVLTCIDRMLPRFGRQIPSFVALSEAPGFACVPTCAPPPKNIPTKKYRAGAFAGHEALLEEPKTFALLRSHDEPLPTEPLPFRGGRSIEDCIGQWRYLPQEVKLKHPTDFVDAIVGGSAPGRDFVHMVYANVIGYVSIPPSDTYIIPDDKRVLGRPFWNLPKDATWETHGPDLWHCKNPLPTSLVRGKLLYRMPKGGRKRILKNELLPEDAKPHEVTMIGEEIGYAFACWLHWFVETRRGWLQPEGLAIDEEPVSLFVMRYNDLSMASMTGHPAFRRGGACALNLPSTVVSPVRHYRVKVCGLDRGDLLEYMRRVPSVDEPPCAMLSATSACFVVGAAGENAQCSADWLSALPAPFTGKGVFESVDPCAPTWFPEAHRVRIGGLGEFARFMLVNYVLGFSGVDRGDGLPGCLRGPSERDAVLDMPLTRVHRAVNRALLWTDIMRNCGGDIKMYERSQELGLEAEDQELLGLISLPPKPGAPVVEPHWGDTCTKNNLHKKFVSIGGTTFGLDFDTIISPLRTLGNDKFVKPKMESGDNRSGYMYYQFETVSDGPLIVAIPGLYPRTGVIEGRRLWAYIPRFDVSPGGPVPVPGVEGALRTSNDVAQDRLKGRMRRLLGVWSESAASRGGNAKAGKGVAFDRTYNSYGKAHWSAFERVFIRTEKRWTVVPCEYMFSEEDLAYARLRRMLGPKFLADAFVYPDCIDNPHFPAYRQTTPRICQRERDTRESHSRSCKQIVLASRPDTVLASIGLGRRAYDPPEPCVSDESALPFPIATTADETATLFAAAQAHGTVYRRVILTNQGDAAPPNMPLILTCNGGVCRVYGQKFDARDSARNLQFLSVLTRAAKNTSQDAENAEDAAMWRHYVARLCMSDEASAARAAPPPGGTRAYRTWRDAHNASEVSAALTGILAAVVEATKSKTSNDIASQLNAMVGSLTFLRDDCARVVTRWMTESEARCILWEGACAVTMLGFIYSGTEGQRDVDSAACVLRRNLMGSLWPDETALSPHTTALVRLFNALTATLHSEPLDSHASTFFVNEDVTKKRTWTVRAVRKGSAIKSERKRAQNATRRDKRFFSDLFLQLVRKKITRDVIVFQSHDGLIEAKGFSTRENIAVQQQQQRASTDKNAEAAMEVARRMPELLITNGANNYLGHFSFVDGQTAVVHDFTAAAKPYMPTRTSMRVFMIFPRDTVIPTGRNDVAIDMNIESIRVSARVSVPASGYGDTFATMRNGAVKVHFHRRALAHAFVFIAK